MTPRRVEISRPFLSISSRFREKCNFSFFANFQNLTMSVDPRHLDEFKSDVHFCLPRHVFEKNATFHSLRILKIRPCQSIRDTSTSSNQTSIFVYLVTFSRKMQLFILCEFSKFDHVSRSATPRRVQIRRPFLSTSSRFREKCNFSFFANFQNLTMSVDPRHLDEFKSDVHFCLPRHVFEKNATFHSLRIFKI